MVIAPLILDALVMVLHPILVCRPYAVAVVAAAEFCRA